MEIRPGILNERTVLRTDNRFAAVREIELDSARAIAAHRVTIRYAQSQGDHTRHEQSGMVSSKRKSAATIN